jgi:hypothetical protein
MIISQLLRRQQTYMACRFNEKAITDENNKKEQQQAGVYPEKASGKDF